MSNRNPVRLSRLLFYRSVLLAALTFSVVYALAAWWLLPQIDRESSERQRQLAHAVAGQVEALLAQPAVSVRGLAASMDFVGQRTSGEVSSFFDAVLDEHVALAALYLIDGQGRVSAVGLPRERRQLRGDLVGMDLSSHVLFSATAGSGKLQWSDATLSPVSAAVSAAVAVRGENYTLVGELAAGELMGVVRTVLERDSGMRTVVLDRRGSVLADTTPQATRRHQSFDFLPRDALHEGQLMAFRLDGVDMVGSSVEAEPLGWRVLVMRPAVEAYRPGRSAELILLVGLAIAVIIGLVGSAVQAGYFERLFSELSAFASGVAQGRYELAWRPSRVKEFNALAAGFARMGRAIDERERVVARSQAAYRELVEGTTELVLRLDAASRVTYANPALGALLGLPQERLIGFSLDSYIVDDAAGTWQNRVHDGLASGASSATFECRMIGSDGEAHCIAWTAHVGHDAASGAVSGYGVIGRDITAQRLAERHLQEINETLEIRVAKRTEALRASNAELSAALDTLRETQESLVQAEKMAALGALVAGVAHELNTPLGNSLIASNTVRDQGRELRQQLEGGLRRSALESYLDDAELASGIIQRNLERAATLVSSFKQVAVDQASSQRRVFALAEVVDEIVMTVRPSLRRRPFKLTAEVDKTLRLDSYPGALGQVLTNLITNAITHGFEDRDAGTVRVRGFAEGAEAAVLEVSDDGLGIPASAQRRIFEPFFTTRMGRGGSGLGLHIVHSLVTNVLSGTITVESTEGEGTRIRVTIPLNAPAAVVESVAPNESAGSAA